MHNMEFQFDCECGTEIADFARGNSAESQFHIACDDCGSIYAVTVTQIRGSD